MVLNRSNVNVFFLAQPVFVGPASCYLITVGRLQRERAREDYPHYLRTCARAVCVPVLCVPVMCVPVMCVPLVRCVLCPRLEAYTSLVWSGLEVLQSHNAKGGGTTTDYNGLQRATTGYNGLQHISAEERHETPWI